MHPQQVDRIRYFSCHDTRLYWTSCRSQGKGKGEKGKGRIFDGIKIDFYFIYAKGLLWIMRAIAILITFHKNF
jgi:hypothetical protein